MAENKYLDIAGVRTLWGAIKTANDNLTTALGTKAASIDYDEASHKIVLKNANGNILGEGIDATPFIKDGMLNDVEVWTVPAGGTTIDGQDYAEGTKFIKFTWNISKEGEQDVKTDYILLSDIATTYTGSDSIVIDDNNVISVGTVESKSVDMDAIPVGGTPLAQVLLDAGIKTINAGNLQTVLESLFSVNTPGTGSRTIPTAATLSMSNPDCSVDNGPVEVGSSVTLSASTKTASASATVTYSGFEYGYSESDNDTKKADGVPPSVKFDAVQDTDTNYQLAFTINEGFTGETVTGASGTSKATKTQSLKTVLGTNKITATATAPTFTISIVGQPKYYICSSLEKTDEDHIVAASAASSIAVSSVSKTASVSVVAVYPVYTNVTSTTGNNSASADTKLIADASVFEVSFGLEANTFNMFAYPDSHTLSSVEVFNTMSKEYEAYSGGSSTSDITKTLLSGDTAYKLWTRSGSAYTESVKFRFTLNKKTSVK